MKPTLTVTKDFVDGFNNTINKLKKDKVLVGVPEDGANRSVGDNINNASILAINHFGSEANNIPPRPVLTIGIRLAQEEIAEQYRLAAAAALEQGPRALDTYYNRAGIIASNSVKKVINDQTDIAGPAESTLDARAARGFKGTKSLLVTGQLRNSITYVVRGNK